MKLRGEPFTLLSISVLLFTILSFTSIAALALGFNASSAFAGTMYLTNDDGRSLAKITPSPFSAQNIGNFGTGHTYAAAFDTNGDLYTILNFGQSLAKVNITTGQATTIGLLVPAGDTMIALEISSTGVMYGADWSQNLFRINKATGQKTLIGKFQIPGRFSVMDLAFDSHDNLYAVDMDKLYRVNISTGAATFVTNITGVVGVMSIAFDETDTLYAMPYSSGAGLYRLNLATGAATLVGKTSFFFPHGGDFPQIQSPKANAGADFSVNEGQVGVTLDGSGSSDPDGDALTYAWTQVSGTSVTLSNATTATPSFDAPLAAIGGETLTFELTVMANGESSVDTVDVTVVNVNHPPVADAGADFSVAEGSPVTLHGEDSFDIDNDSFTYAWIQVSGPTVILTSANTANPTFTAPFGGTGGTAGIVATLVFELTVDDGFPQDAPVPGYSFANVVDTVTVDITNVNNDPTANAGTDQTVDENTPVALSGIGSSDPDSDPLSYSWTQVGGPPVALSNATTATPSFTAPFVSPGGAAFEFQLTVDDGYGATATDIVVVNVQNINDPPNASLARPTTAVLWPPNHGMVPVAIVGVSDPNNNATITITGVTQDEPTNGLGDGDTPIDAVINGDGTVLLRAERSGNGDGRVYKINFTASDFEGSSSGSVFVTVPHGPKKPAIDSGQNYNSTN